MALIQFLDRSSAARPRQWTTQQSTLRAATDSRNATSQKGGRAYYLKAVPKKRWADKKVPEWTAALDDDAPD